MNYALLRFLFSVFLFGLAGSIVSAEEPVSLQPVADASVDAGAPERNFGADLKLNSKSLGSTTTGARKAYLRFDLASTGGKRIARASLRLILAQIKWARNDEDAKFNLYMIQPASMATGSAEVLGPDWSEDDITWKNAPANRTDSGSKIRDAETVPDGVAAGFAAEAVLPKFAESGEPIEPGRELLFDDTKFAAMLDAAPRGPVTLIVVRTSGGSETDTLFAARENTAYTPPSLLLELEDK